MYVHTFLIRINLTFPIIVYLSFRYKCITLVTFYNSAKVYIIVQEFQVMALFQT